MAFDKSLLDIVCCPVTHVPLGLMPDEIRARLNALIAERRIRNRAEQLVTEPLTAALLTRDGRVAYPIRDDILVLLEDEGIPLAQADLPAGILD